MKALRPLFYVALAIGVLTSLPTFVLLVQGWAHPDVREFRPAVIDTFAANPNIENGFYVVISLLAYNFVNLGALILAVVIWKKEKKDGAFYIVGLSGLVVAVSCIIACRPSYQKKLKEDSDKVMRQLVEKSVSKFDADMRKAESEKFRQALDEELKTKTKTSEPTSPGGRDSP